MMTGVALDHEDKLDDILKGLEDLNKSEAEKREARKKKKSEADEDDVFSNAVSFVSKANKWKKKGSTSELEKERAKVVPKASSTSMVQPAAKASKFKTAANMNKAASAFGSGAKNKKPSPQGSTSSYESSGSFKVKRTASEKAKKASYKTAENKDGTMTRTFSQKYKT